MFYLYAYCETGDEVYDGPIWYGINLHMVINGRECKDYKIGSIEEWGNGERYWKNVMEVKTI